MSTVFSECFVFFVAIRWNVLFREGRFQTIKITKGKHFGFVSLRKREKKLPTNRKEICLQANLSILFSIINSWNKREKKCFRIEWTQRKWTTFALTCDGSHSFGLFFAHKFSRFSLIFFGCCCYYDCAIPTF